MTVIKAHEQELRMDRCNAGAQAGRTVVTDISTLDYVSPTVFEEA